MTDVVSQLASAGLSVSEAARKSELFATIDRLLQGNADARRWFVPGRIEVLGKHTDYAGGPTLICTAERGICVSSAQRADSMVRVVDACDGRAVEFPLSANIEIPVGWTNYVATVVRRVARNFPGADRGVTIVFASDLPRSAGLSSSSALMIAIFTAIAEVNRLWDRPELSGICSVAESLAGYLACIENGRSYGDLTGDRGVGTFGGSEDHTAILCCRAGQLSQYRFCPTRLERRVDFSSDWRFVIANSGIHANKTGAARDLYNHASLLAAAVLNIWNSATGRNDASLDCATHSATADDLRNALQSAKHAEFSAIELVRRFDHFMTESELVSVAATAFEKIDMSRLGEVVDHSQAAAEQLLGNQVPETISLARTARELGAIAASAFGAGFGGSVWALVGADEAAQFADDWYRAYVSQHPAQSSASRFFVSRPGPNLTRIVP